MLRPCGLLGCCRNWNSLPIPAWIAMARLYRFQRRTNVYGLGSSSTINSEAAFIMSQSA